MSHVPMDLAKMVALYLVKPVITPHKWIPQNKLYLVIDASNAMFQDIYTYWKHGPTYIHSGNLDWDDLFTNPEKINILEQTINDIKSKTPTMKWQDTCYMAKITKSYPEINNEFLLLNHHLIDIRYTNEKIINKSKQVYNTLNNIEKNSCVLL